jgi:hypothetical protein
MARRLAILLLVASAAAAIGGAAAAARPAATAPAHSGAAPAYVGRFGPPGFYSRFGKPSAYKPRQLHPFSADDNAYLYGLHWKDWGHGTARATGKAAANDCQPNCAQGHFVHAHGARARAYRLRAGECHGKPGRFYTRTRLHFPKKTHLNDFTVKLVTGCGVT